MLGGLLQAVCRLRRTLVPHQPGQDDAAVRQAVPQVELLARVQPLPQRHRAVPPAGLLQVGASLQRLLTTDLVLVELGEVVDDDRDGQRDDEDAADTAEEADELAWHGLGHHVPVAHGGHGDGGPPEGVGDRGEVRAHHLALGEVGEAGEDEDAQGEKHEE